MRSVCSSRNVLLSSKRVYTGNNFNGIVDENIIRNIVCINGTFERISHHKHFKRTLCFINFPLWRYFSLRPVYYMQTVLCFIRLMDEPVSLTLFRNMHGHDSTSRYVNRWRLFTHWCVLCGVVLHILQMIQSYLDSEITPVSTENRREKVGSDSFVCVST